MPDLLDLETYNYQLPQELIAQYPLPDRGSSRLLHLDRETGDVSHLSFRDIVSHLNPGEVLILNSSRVIPARLFGRKDNGTQVEVLLVNKLSDSTWRCMVHPGRRLKKEQWIEFSPTLKGFVSLPDEDGLREIEFSPAQDYWQIIEEIGHMPLPPYIRRTDEASDRNRYQTVYATEPGSVAAPTAGLHFDSDLLDELKQKGVQIRYVVLHVGLGTFLPVKSERIDQHKMHSEYCTVPPETAEAVNSAIAGGRRVIAVGSTSMRTLESFTREGRLESGSRWTDIFIYPGYRFQIASALITNFHLPKSSLLMMISAFAGLENVMKAYQMAVRERYRFFSYGDAMYIS
ncbi:MAG TPA: tRNA preQ1(34) S-adenosylmethionine ribosyltransferase-isomerase QueA [Candidatus Cloacimonadota bacterium]|jgi:S-adenosylmethionine:tRNA ribosyltransferase-isomerase|nr:tRNA preQ1(34) S-adenosylmethionine ribosyltransferase-isomerase QueA [Candidatus Cloacimonadota bacterium]HOF59698.1 tRNA preQ1(34) S-adenosylmethionine ribosyltransferase-isomerase QueA [Candidatus Cloacimonadota bacterium]HOR58973.1 tRNA preQ1(34) S-adenosylmethionine ribosyltransferase-isomerase QueA [Candidatus Cloacimonadota bacterium]HPB09353.1 tRNA preQ1(34) S-adenosylmethionine ribosyltransferase-isomerase QueA [Candidatus Cloacimonadota bacterium]HPL23201.1 tRNA preQ1(34) S-adenosy